MFKLVENYVSRPDGIYDINNEAGLYVEEVGTKARFINDTPCLNPTIYNNVNRRYNDPNTTFNFNDSFYNYWYDLYHSYIYITGTINPDNNVGNNYSQYDNIRVLSDCWIQRLSLQINGIELNNNIGSKNFLHLSAHLLNLLKNTPEWAKKVQKFYHFFPDTGDAGGAITQKLNVNTRVAQLANAALNSGGINAVTVGNANNAGGAVAVAQNLAGTQNNTILVGANVGFGTQALPVTQPTVVPDDPADNAIVITVQNQNYITFVQDIALGGTTPVGINQALIGTNTSADGNIYFRTKDNPLYNEGFTEACKLYAKSKAFAVVVPLRFYCPSLQALQGLYTGYTLALQITCPTFQEMLFSANRGTDVNPQGGNMLPLQGNIQFTNLIYRVPSYLPDEERLLELKRKQNSNITERRTYLDVDTIESPLINPANGFFTINFPNCINAKPKYVIIAFKQSISKNNQNGNTHMYFNPQLTSIRIRIGNTVYIPNNKAFACDPTKNDYTELFGELLKMQENTIRSGEWDEKLIDYETFINHKFFCVFDCNEIDSEVFNLQTAVDLNVEVNINNSAITGGGAVNTALQASYTGDILRVPLTPITIYTDPVTPGNNITIPNPYIGTPLGPFYVYAFVFSEKKIDVMFSDQGLQVKPYFGN